MENDVSNPRILLVDDNATIRKTLKKILVQIELHVQEAGSAQEALSLLEIEAFDCILTDWSMPEMSGLELLKAIRQHPKLAKTPVVMISANTFSDDIIKAVREGVNGYIAKPFEAETVISKIQQVLSSAKNS